MHKFAKLFIVISAKLNILFLTTDMTDMQLKLAEGIHHLNQHSTSSHSFTFAPSSMQLGSNNLGVPAYSNLIG
jgi:hypothetical protein